MSGVGTFFTSSLGLESLRESVGRLFLSNQLSVKVLDSGDSFESYTHPANARKLVSAGSAFILSTTPFVIKLRGVHSERKSKMIKSKIVTNFTEMFKEETDIWVQNVGGTQISMQFVSPGGQVAAVLIPRSKKPFNLSTYVPFSALKNSRDLRQILNRRPARLIPLTTLEVDAYFEKLAKDRKSSVEHEIEQAFLEQSALMEHRAYVEPETEVPKPIAKQVKEAEAAVDPEEVVTPRIIGLIKSADKTQDASHRMGARQLKDELEVLVDEMTSADLDYIIQLAPKSVSKWAASLLASKPEVTEIKLPPVPEAPSSDILNSEN